MLDFLNDYYEDVEQSEPERALFESAKPVSPLSVTRQNPHVQGKSEEDG